MGKQVHVHVGEPILLVDCSYYIFHRYFATFRWYSFRFPKEEHASLAAQLHECEEFCDAFYKHIRSDLAKWMKTWGVPHGNIIFGCDCRRGDIWRNAFHDGYKHGRTASSTFNPAFFGMFYQWLAAHAEQLGVMSMEYEQLEADDVIYLIVGKIQRAQPGTKIVIITNDNDYLQIRGENVEIVNAQLHELSKRSIGTPEQDLLHKIVMGDVSDNIPAIAPKLGPVTAKKLALQGREAVEEWAKKKGCMDKLLHNERMIAFAHIPPALIMGFEDAYDWCFV